MKILLLCIFSLISAVVVKAQSDEAKISGPLILVETRGSGVATKSDIKLNTMELDLTFGYAFNRRIALYVPLTETVGMFKKGDSKTYETPLQLGAGVGYSPLNTSRFQFEIVGRAGTTLIGDWKYVYYDAGVRLGFTNSVFVGIGVRYFSTYKGDFGNHCNFYGAVGFRFNRFKNRTME